MPPDGMAAIRSAMEKRRIGSSDLAIAPLVLGGNVFGWTAEEATSFRILDAFVDAGGTMIDTADVYSNWVEGHMGGESETVIGRWLERCPGKRARVQIATKVGFLDGEIVDGEWVAALQPEVVARACEASLRRLGTDCIDLYYQHADNPGIPLSDSLGAMDALVKAGKVRAIGLSQYRPDRLRVAVETAHREGLTAPCALQTWYNLVERAKLEGPLLDAATDCGLGVLSFFSLANGFLTGKYRSKSDLAKSARGDRSAEYLDDRGMRVLAALDDVAADTGAALGAVALAWTMVQPGIAGALASATSVEQLNQNMAALALTLSPAQIARLSEASA